MYHDLLGFLPGVRESVGAEVTYRVTGNVITSQVAGMVVSGMYGTEEDVPLLKQVGISEDFVEFSSHV